MTDNPTCNRCGKKRSAHGPDQMTLEPVKCPVSGRDEDDLVQIRDPERR
jgi:hypothetical protein